MKSQFVRFALTAFALMTAGGDYAAGDQAVQQSSSPASAQTAPEATAMTEGEVRRIDAANKKITLKHGEIKNLEMPPMTMVFRVADAGVVGDLKPGDKVRFRAEQVSGAYHVQRIEKAP